MKKTILTLAPKSQYTAPQSEEIKVAVEANIMSYGDPNSPGGTLPEYSGDPYSI